MGNSASGSGFELEFPFDEPDVALDVWYNNDSFVSDYASLGEHAYDNHPTKEGFWIKVAIWAYESYDSIRLSIWHNGKNVTQDFQLAVDGSNLKLGEYPVNAVALDGYGQEDFYFHVDRKDREGLYWRINTLYSRYLLKGSIDDQIRVVFWVNTKDFLKTVNDLGLSSLDVLKSNEKKIDVAKRIIPTPVSALGFVIPFEPLVMPLTIAMAVTGFGVWIWNAIEKALTVKRTKTLFGKRSYTSLNCDASMLKALLNGPTTESGFQSHASKEIDDKDMQVSPQRAYHPIFSPNGDIDVGFGTRSSCSIDAS